MQTPQTVLTVVQPVRLTVNKADVLYRANLFAGPTTLARTSHNEALISLLDFVEEGLVVSLKEREGLFDPICLASDDIGNYLLKLCLGPGSLLCDFWTHVIRDNVVGKGFEWCSVVQGNAVLLQGFICLSEHRAQQGAIGDHSIVVGVFL